ncbi:MAG TPA: FAD-binding oxidoreductase [Acidimicrobiales bacterium]|nr:FAD-binding oxidoreductase [Acidimicrobiales bacterium]
MTEPTPVTPIEAAAGEVVERLGGPRVPVDDALVERLRGACAEVRTDDECRDELGRDWWPLALRWALRGAVPARPGAVARPTDAAQVAAVLAVCHDARVPVTAAAGRSGVCGSSVPVFGGVALDLCGLAGVAALDTTSLVADVAAGTFGPDLERVLRAEDATLGHWPQSMDLSTVGGWIACRGAGQYSTRYGKIEDMVVGLEVALADGRIVRTGGSGPRAAVGPDLSQLIVGAEGTLGVITEARLRLHALPGAEGRGAWAFADFATGLEACRRVLRRGATPAVLRLYDEVESARNFDVEGRCLLVVLDEADPALLEATMSVVAEECEVLGATIEDTELVERWVSHRNDVSALAPLYRAGVVVDTIEIAARWSALGGIYTAAVEGLRAVQGTLAASAHQSHAYGDGACLYFTFGGRMPDTTPGAGDPAVDDAWAERYYTTCWDTVTAVVREAGGAISHHHGVGLNRGRYVADALGEGFGVLCAVKNALDPRGILNPGKLGLPSPFGEVPWP